MARPASGLGGLLGKSDLGKTGAALVDQFMRKKLGRRKPAPPPAKAPEPDKPKPVVVTSAGAVPLPQPKPVASGKPAPAEIFTTAEFGNAFSIRTDLHALAGRGRVSFGPYQSPGRTNGYRLVLSPEGRSWLELRSVSSCSRVISTVGEAPTAVAPEGGLIEGTRLPNGMMTISIDERLVPRSVDQGYHSDHPNDSRRTACLYAHVNSPN